MAQYVLLPGLDGSGKLFDRFIEHANQDDDITIVRYPTDAIKLGDLCHIARQKIAVVKQPIVIAESYSGAVLCQLLRERVPMRAAIFSASFGKTPHYRLTSLSQFVPARLSEIAMPMAIANFCLNGVNKKNEANQRLLQQALRTVKATPHETIIGRLHELSGMSNALIVTTTPVLALQAKRERLLDRAATRSLAEVLHHARFVEIDGPHFLLQTAPDDCWRAIFAFVSCPATSPITHPA